MIIERTEQTPGGSPTPSDQELVARTLQGDRDAFGTLVQRYRELAIGVAYRICGNAALAEDVAQDAFIRVWQKLSSFCPEGNFRGWLCRITANLTIDALRRQKPTANVDDLALVAPGMSPESHAAREEQAAVVRAALMRLPLISRTVLVLREYQSLSYQEIADALDIPLGTVRSRLNDARRRLRAELAPYLELNREE